MKKILSVVLAALMIIAMIPVVFAASTPVITTSVDKTTVKVGDTVTVTVSVSANSNLCALDYELRYKSSDFEVVSGSQSLKGVFGYEAAKDNVMSSGNNAFKYSGATSGKVSNSAATLFTVKLKAKTTSGKITAVVTGAYTSSGDSDYTDVTSAVAAASAKNIVFSGTTTPDTPTNYDYIEIATPSATTIRYKDGIVLHAEINKTLPNNAKLVWSTDNDNFKTSVSEDGESYTIISNSKGTTKITLTLYDATGTTVLDADTIEMTSKAGFFDKISAFFRNLFGSPEILPR